MRNLKKLQIVQLDNKIAHFKNAENISMPPNGWISAIRTTLNMTLAQLGRRLNITRQGVKKIEESEAKGSITLNSLQEVATALDCKLVYGLVPIHGSIEKLIDEKVQQLAHQIVLRTNQNMKLEDQGISDEKIKESMNDLAEELKRELKKSIWD